MQISKIHNSLWESPPVFILPESFVEVEGVQVYEFRGCNGSGKSTLPKLLIANDHSAKLVSNSDVSMVYCHTFKTIIVGQYPEGANCGGCDRISGNENIANAVIEAVKYAKKISAETSSGVRVIYEGIMASTTNFAIISKLLEPNTGIDESNLNICFMDTTIETCLARISKRNNGKEFNERNVKSKHRQISNQPFNLNEYNSKLKLFTVENENTNINSIIFNWCVLNYKKLVL